MLIYQMCCTFYSELICEYNLQIGHLQAEFWTCKVTRSRENLLQHTKLHHCSYISLLNLQHILLKGSEIAFNGSIYLISKASPTNSGLAVQMKSILKGSGASKYLEICPDLTLKEHYIHTAHRSLNQFG